MILVQYYPNMKEVYNIIYRSVPFGISQKDGFTVGAWRVKKIIK